MLMSHAYKDVEEFTQLSLIQFMLTLLLLTSDFILLGACAVSKDV